MLPARNGTAFSLTVHNASASHYTLVVMTVVALIFTPIVLAYQAWTYWVFRARVGAASVGGDATSAAGRLRDRANTIVRPDTDPDQTAGDRPVGVS